MSERPIIVGVDGCASSTGALFWAADEARLRARSLLVVHSPAAARADLVGVAVPGLRAMDAYADHLLSAHAAAASARQPAVAVTSLLGHGDPGDTLVDLSAVAAMVVLGLHSPHAAYADLAGRVAAQAHSAVVVVPEGHDLRGGPRGVVFLARGLGADDHARAVASEEAFLREMSWRTARVDGVSGVPAAAASARSAALVVVPAAARPHRHGPDPVLSAVLAIAACPVMIVRAPALPVSATTMSAVAGHVPDMSSAPCGGLEKLRTP